MISHKVYSAGRHDKCILTHSGKLVVKYHRAINYGSIITAGQIQYIQTYYNLEEIRLIINIGKLNKSLSGVFFHMTDIKNYPGYIRELYKIEY